MTAAVSDLVVVGAGPAGLAAATEAAGRGLDVVLLDEGAAAGGQFFRQPGSGVPAARSDRQQALGAARIAALPAGVSHWPRTSVWAVEPTRVVWAERDGDLLKLQPRALVLATGAYDRPVAFPGWTLPGVMSAGAAQAICKAQRVRPGRRAVVAGSGPFSLAAATTLMRAGVRVVEVVEAAPLSRLLAVLPASLTFTARHRELLRYVSALTRRGVRLRLGMIVVAAGGDDRLTSVRLHSVRDEGASRVVEADLLCLAYGFTASTELAQLAGCELIRDPVLGQRVPRVDAWQQSSVAGVFVAGEACGLGGADAAELEGRAAGLGAARYVGAVSDADATDAVAPVWRSLVRERRFAALLGRAFPTAAALPVVDDRTVVCRCEGVRFGAAREAIADGARTLDELKATTRCGMGLCQGRLCGPALAPLLRRLEPGFDDESPFTARPPARPITVATLCAP